jgi:hypothetical protein
MNTHGQSRGMSAVETCTSTIIGLSVAYTTQLVVFPLYDIHVTHATHAGITLIFTVVSLVRGYLVRRLFNASPWQRLKFRRQQPNEDL